MSGSATLFKLLQLGDSFFPSGASVFSHGLEGLAAEAPQPDAAGVEQFVRGQLEQRWASSDRVALLHSHAAGGDLERVAEIDAYVEASCLVSSWREGGRRLGRSLLSTHVRLGTPHAADYAGYVRAGRAPGQASAVHGMIAAASGLSADAAAVLGAYGLAVGLVSAALRLGLVGHVDAQRILDRQQARVEMLVALPLPPLEELGGWVPEAEIASMRQEARRGRLFAS